MNNGRGVINVGSEVGLVDQQQTKCSEGPNLQHKGGLTLTITHPASTVNSLSVEKPVTYKQVKKPKKPVIIKTKERKQVYRVPKFLESEHGDPKSDSHKIRRANIDHYVTQLIAQNLDDPIASRPNHHFLSSKDYKDLMTCREHSNSLYATKGSGDSGQHGIVEHWRTIKNKTNDPKDKARHARECQALDKIYDTLTENSNKIQMYAWKNYSNYLAWTKESGVAIKQHPECEHTQDALRRSSSSAGRKEAVTTFETVRTSNPAVIASLLDEKDRVQGQADAGHDTEKAHAEKTIDELFVSQLEKEGHVSTTVLPDGSTIVTSPLAKAEPLPGPADTGPSSNNTKLPDPTKVSTGKEKEMDYVVNFDLIKDSATGFEFHYTEPNSNWTIEATNFIFHIISVLYHLLTFSVPTVDVIGWVLYFLSFIVEVEPYYYGLCYNLLFWDLSLMYMCYHFNKKRELNKLWSTFFLISAIFMILLGFSTNIHWISILWTRVITGAWCIRHMARIMYFTDDHHWKIVDDQDNYNRYFDPKCDFRDHVSQFQDLKPEDKDPMLFKVKYWDPRGFKEGELVISLSLYAILIRTMNTISRDSEIADKRIENEAAVCTQVNLNRYQFLETGLITPNRDYQQCLESIFKPSIAKYINYILVKLMSHGFPTNLGGDVRTNTALMAQHQYRARMIQLPAPTRMDFRRPQ